MPANTLSRPVMLVVDDDPPVLAAIERDMRARYGGEYLVMAAPGGEAALSLARDIKRRGGEIALLLVDQRMPGMSGLELLEAVRPMYPEARKVLLTAYSDTSVAIQAINEIGLHYYLVKPWHPPEESLYPVIDDVMSTWWATRRPVGEIVQVLGHRWSAVGSRLKDFLASNRVPYRFLDLDRDTEAIELLAALDPEPALPAVLLSDGTVLARPDVRELAERIGLAVTATDQGVHDLVIVGAGPAGLAAAVYGSSEGLDTVVVERWAIGGQAGTTSKIENYLGFPMSISGAELARRAEAQARRFDSELLTAAEAVDLRVEDPTRVVVLADGTEIRSKSVLIATGMTIRTLDGPGFDELRGAGVYYGATASEASSFKGEHVFVIGGANSAGQAAIMLAGHAESVTMVVRAKSLGERMSAYLVDQVEATPNITVLTESEVVAAEGQQHLTGVRVVDRRSGEESLHSVTGLFVFIGAVPHTDFVRGVLMLNEAGFVLTGPNLLTDGKPPPGWPLKRLPFMLETNVPGVFAAGDVRHGSIRRVAAAVGAGSAALTFIHEYLSSV